MKRNQTTESQAANLKLKLHRETLLALEPPDLEHEEGVVTTSACKSGWTCCGAAC